MGKRLVRKGWSTRYVHSKLPFTLAVIPLKGRLLGLYYVHLHLAPEGLVSVKWFYGLWQEVFIDFISIYSIRKTQVKPAINENDQKNYWQGCRTTNCATEIRKGRSDGHSNCEFNDKIWTSRWAVLIIWNIHIFMTRRWSGEKREGTLHTVNILK